MRERSEANSGLYIAYIGGRVLLTKKKKKRQEHSASANDRRLGIISMIPPKRREDWEEGEGGRKEMGKCVGLLAQTP